MDPRHTGIVAAWYDAAPCASDADMWADYAQWLRSLDLRGFVPTQGDPYASCVALRRAAYSNEPVSVYMGGEIENGHPVWSQIDNYRFRCVHETAHIESEGAFSFQGELAACEKQVSYTPNFAEVIRTEIVGQFCFFAWQGGVFAPNKATRIPSDVFKGARFDKALGVFVTDASEAFIRAHRARVHKSVGRLL
jgi:hypothetical protein